MTDTTSIPVIKDVAVTATPPLSPLVLGVRRFRKHRMAMFGLVLLVMLILFISFAGLFSHGYCAPLGREVRGEDWANCNDTSLKLQPPSGNHIFGTL